MPYPRAIAGDVLVEDLERLKLKLFQNYHANRQDLYSYKLEDFKYSADTETATRQHSEHRNVRLAIQDLEVVQKKSSTASANPVMQVEYFLFNQLTHHSVNDQIKNGNGPLMTSVADTALYSARLLGASHHVTVPTGSAIKAPRRTIDASSKLLI